MNSPAVIDHLNKKHSNLSLVLSCLACLLIGLVVGHIVTFHWMRHDLAGFRTPYQAVLLSNGAVYYGRLSAMARATQS